MQKNKKLGKSNAPDGFPTIEKWESVRVWSVTHCFTLIDVLTLFTRREKELWANIFCCYCICWLERRSFSHSLTFTILKDRLKLNTILENNIIVQADNSSLSYSSLNIVCTISFQVKTNMGLISEQFAVRIYRCVYKWKSIDKKKLDCINKMSYMF